jgi:glycosidase
MAAIGWAGVDSIPVIHKDLAEVLDYFVLGEDSITKRWLAAGASGWRLDVSGDPTFPDDWWSTFREVVKAADPDALTVAEQWQKDTTLLRQLRGDRFDTTMNYRFRDAVLGFLAPGLFDRKGFAASGAQTDPADFAARMLSQQEDYAPAAYLSLLNLLDSHDTERVLWTLTPGDETRADREWNVANVAEGLQRLRLAALIQFTMPGAPMVYYGDEVGLTGDDDPDDRRTYPWGDLGGTPDQDLLEFYRTVGSLRSTQAALTDGDLRFLLVGSDDDGTIAYGRRTDQQAAIVAINRSAETRVLAIPVDGFVPDGTTLRQMYPLPSPGVGPTVVEGGVVRLELGPMSGVVLVSLGGDLDSPDAPTDLTVSGPILAGATFAWDESAGAVGYNLYGSPVSGGGYVRINREPIGEGTVTAGSPWLRYFVVTALDSAGNESSFSDEVTVSPPA